MCEENQKESDAFAAWWEMMQQKLQTAQTFQLHCWNEETEEINLAL